MVTTAGPEVTNFYFRYWIPYQAVSIVETTDEVALRLVDGRRVLWLRPIPAIMIFVAVERSGIYG